MPYAVYVPARRGEIYLIHSIKEREEDAWDSAGKRNGAIVLWGMKDTFTYRLAKAEALQRSHRKPTPGAEPGPTTTD